MCNIISHVVKCNITAVKPCVLFHMFTFPPFLLYRVNNLSSMSVYSVLSRSCSLSVVVDGKIATVVAIAITEQLEFPFVSSVFTYVAALCLLLSLVTFIGITLVKCRVSHFTIDVSQSFMSRYQNVCLISTEFSSYNYHIP